MGSVVITMLSILRTRFCRNLFVARERADVDVVCNTVLSVCSSSDRCVVRHAVSRSEADNTSAVNSVILMDEPEGDLVSAEPEPEDGEAAGATPEIGAGAEPEPGAEDGEADGVVWAVAEAADFRGAAGIWEEPEEDLSGCEVR